MKKGEHIKVSRIKYDDLAKSRFAPFCSTGEDFSSTAIRNKFGWFHPHLRPALTRARPVDGLFASPSNMITMVSASETTRLYIIPVNQARRPGHL